MKKILVALSISLVVMVIVLVSVISRTPRQVEGSVMVGSESNATTSPTGFGNSTEKLVITGPAVLNNIVLTGTNTGVVYFYDATTTDITKRTNNTPTSTLLVASFPASAATGTYVFDISVKNGLMYQSVGNAPTTTITFRTQ